MSFEDYSFRITLIRQPRPDAKPVEPWLNMQELAWTYKRGQLRLCGLSTSDIRALVVPGVRTRFGVKRVRTGPGYRSR